MIVRTGRLYNRKPERRRNLLKWSEDLSNAVWASGGRVTVTADQADAPDGAHTAEKLAPQNASDSFLYQIFPQTIGVVTFSVWLKSTAGNRTFQIQLSGAVFHATKTVVVTGNWQRFSVSGPVTGDATPLGCIGGGSSWTTGNDVYAWGAQMNPGSNATPYLKTAGTAL